MLIIDCVSKHQGLKTLDIITYKDHRYVESFRLGTEAMAAQLFEDVEGVFEDE